jgi:hypothetical protein
VLPRNRRRAANDRKTNSQAHSGCPKAERKRVHVWDDTVSGFGVRVRPTGAMSYVVVYRASQGAAHPFGGTPPIAAVGKIAPERARARAKAILGSVAHGHDPADQNISGN